MEEERAVPIPTGGYGGSGNNGGGGGGRRKSSSFNLKAFNLKRQLSKVDMKIKNSGKSIKEKRNSIFYSESTSPHQDFVDHLEEEGKLSLESDDRTLIENQIALSPRDATKIILENDCDDDNIQNDNNNGRTRDEDAQLLSDDDLDNQIICGSVGTQYELNAINKKVSSTRPDNLDLVDENGFPVRPPRRIKKKLLNNDKRDQRLLSVPNIKFQKPLMCDLRDKEEKCEINQQQSSSTSTTFAGHLKRRFSKF